MSTPFVNLNAWREDARGLRAAEDAPQDEGVDALALHFEEPVRCRRCGETQARGTWCDGAGECCEDHDCPMKGYQP